MRKRKKGKALFISEGESAARLNKALPSSFPSLHKRLRGEQITSPFYLAVFTPGVSTWVAPQARHYSLLFTWPPFFVGVPLTRHKDQWEEFDCLYDSRSSSLCLQLSLCLCVLVCLSVCLSFTPGSPCLVLASQPQRGVEGPCQHAFFSCWLTVNNFFPSPE